jgi:tetratricopeptide (TPR) repeat protein
MRTAVVRTIVGVSALLLALGSASWSQDKKKQPGKEGAPVPGSIVEDRTARKLLEAGDARMEANETGKAVEVWQSVIERYPRSKVRHEAQMRLGTFYLERERAYDRARSYFEPVAAEENTNEAQRATATLKIGVCYYESRNFGKCFKYMREVIERYPVSPEVNQAYYYVGLGHFQQGHYSRAIAALERVGTALSGEEKKVEVLEAGKRLFIRIDDADLAALEAGKTVKVTVAAASGDTETVDCHPIGRNVRVVLGSIPTALGKAKPGNGRLEIRGGDKVRITYIDQHTSEGAVAKKVEKEIAVVGNATVAIMDGAYAETLSGVVLGRGINVQITDADFDLTDGADVLKATVEVYREKTQEEINAEGPPAGGPAKPDSNKLDRFKKIDRVEVVLTEVKVERAVSDTPALEEEPAKKEDRPMNEEKEPAKKEDSKKEEDTSIHSGVFRTVVQLAKSETVVAGDAILQALPNDLIVVTYVDQRNTTGEPRTLQFRARCVEGSLGGVRVTQTQISDQELRVKTQLKTASALTNIGNRYKEFGLKQHADTKYQQALKMCEDVSAEAVKLGGRTLEETYVQLWRIYFEMDNLPLAAAMSQRLQREFPNSEFVDAALLQLAQVARKQNQFQRAIGIYGNLLAMEKSPLRGEAQYGIAECYEEMAKVATEAAARQLFDRSFQEYKKVYDLYPDSGRVGEAVAKMANYYYQQKDYARAIDTFERVLQAQPDAKFLDVILFNYGRCLYRLDRKGDARKQFDHLIQDFPESPLATDAKKISEALRKGGF